MPETLNDHYHQAWKRVTEQTNHYRRDQARIALTWVLLAKQPLSVLALREAVATCTTDTLVGGADFLPDIERLCTGLVKLEKHPCPRWIIGDGLCTTMGAHTRVVVTHTSISEYFVDRRHMYLPSGERLLVSACLKIMRQSLTMAVHFDPMTSVRDRKFFEPLWTPLSGDNLPTAETALQYAMVCLRFHLSGLSALQRLETYPTLLVMTMPRASFISFVGLFFTLGVLCLNDFSHFDDGSFPVLTTLHYHVGQSLVVRLLQVLEQQWASSLGPSKVLVRELPCHPSLSHGIICFTTCAYVMQAYLAGQTAHFGLKEWGPLLDIFFCGFLAGDYNPDTDSGKTILMITNFMGLKS